MEGRSRAARPAAAGCRGCGPRDRRRRRTTASRARRAERAAATCCSIRASESKTRPSDPRSAALALDGSSTEPVPDIAAVGWQGPDAARGSVPAAARPAGPSDRSVATSRPGASLRLPQARAKQAMRRRRPRLPTVRRVRRQPRLPGPRALAPRQRRRGRAISPVRGRRRAINAFQRAIVLAIARDERTFSTRAAASPAGRRGDNVHDVARRRGCGFPMHPRGPGVSRACSKAIVSREQRFDLRPGRTSRPCEDSPMPARAAPADRDRDRRTRSAAARTDAAARPLDSGASRASPFAGRWVEARPRQGRIGKRIDESAHVQHRRHRCRFGKQGGGSGHVAGPFAQRGDRSAEGLSPRKRGAARFDVAEGCIHALAASARCWLIISR